MFEKITAVITVIKQIQIIERLTIFGQDLGRNLVVVDLE